MSLPAPSFGEDPLARLDRCKRRDVPAGASLGAEMLAVYQKEVVPRQSKLGRIAEAWCRVVPEPLQKHASLEGMTRGRLTVVVDSAPHLYQLKQVLLAGGEKQLLMQCRGVGLRRVALKRGRWYDDAGRPTF